MDNKLKCKICGELIKNWQIVLMEHLDDHGVEYLEGIEENEDVDEWVSSYFDSIENPMFEYEIEPA